MNYPFEQAMNYSFEQVVFLLFNYNQTGNRSIVTLLQLRLRNLSIGHNGKHTPHIRSREPSQKPFAMDGSRTPVFRLEDRTLRMLVITTPSPA